MAVVDIVLTAGQSQMSGVGTGVDAPDTDPAMVFEWDGPVAGVLGECYDPWPTSRNSETEYEPQTGSSIPAFANTFTAYSGRPLMVVRAAKGGTAVLHENEPPQGDWSPEGLLFGQSVAKFNAAVTALLAAGHTVGDVFVINSIGFADAKGGNALETFSDGQTGLLTRWQAQLTVPPAKMYIEKMYVPHVSSMTPELEANCLIVISEQEESVNASGGTIQFALEGHGDRCYENGWLKFDKLHYNQTGLNDMGYRFATHIANDLGYDSPSEPPVLNPPAQSSLLGRRLLFSLPWTPPPAPTDPPDYAGSAQHAVAAGTTAIPVPTAGLGTITPDEDILVAFCWCSSGATTWANAGWTIAAAGNDSAILWKIADGTEGSSITINRTGSSTAAGVRIVRYTGANVDSPVDAAAVSTATGATLVLTGVDPATAHTRLVQFAAKIGTGGTGWTPPGTATEHADGVGTGTALLSATGDEELVDDAASGDRTWTGSGLGGTRGGVIALKAA